MVAGPVLAVIIHGVADLIVNGIIKETVQRFPAGYRWLLHQNLGHHFLIRYPKGIFYLIANIVLINGLSQIYKALVIDSLTINEAISENS